VRTLPPSEYEGQQLCPCCGDDGTGTSYYVCAETSPIGQTFTHAESCQRYDYAADLCSQCDGELRDWMEAQP
jgi:hypothetical protein